MDKRGADPVSCVVCGATCAEGPPPSWTLQREGSRDRWMCESCTRQNVRDIEGRLDFPY